MVESLAWKDLSEQTLVTILKPTNLAEVRENVREAFGIPDDGDEHGEIVTDLYYNTIIFAREKNLTMLKMSTLISIVKVLHEQSTVGRMPMDKSWEKTKKMLITHSLQRPPFSVGIFSFADLQAITHYLLHTYFRHYKMYQYAFTPTFVISIETLETVNLAEPPPQIAALRSFATQAEYDKQKEEEEAVRVEQARLAAEEARQREIEAAYLAAIPDEITQKVIDALAKHLEVMKKQLNEQISVTEDKVDKKIVDIDSRISSPKTGSNIKASESKAVSSKAGPKK